MEKKQSKINIFNKALGEIKNSEAQNFFAVYFTNFSNQPNTPHIKTILNDLDGIIFNFQEVLEIVLKRYEFLENFHALDEEVEKNKNELIEILKKNSKEFSYNKLFPIFNEF